MEQPAKVEVAVEEPKQEEVAQEESHPAHPESPAAAKEETPVAAKEETPVKAKEETPVKAKEDSPVAAKEETPVKAKEETPVKAKEETPVKAKEESHPAHPESPADVKCGSHLKSVDDLTGFPEFPEGTRSSLSRHLTRAVWDELHDKKDAAGVSFKTCIISGC